MDAHVFVSAAVCVFERVAALRAEVALDVYAVVLLDLGAKLLRDEVQRLFVHRAVFDRVDRARLVARPLFEAALEHRDYRGLAAADRPHQKEYALAYFETLRRGLEILDEARNRLLDAEEFAAEELVSRDLVARPLVQFLHAPGVNHVVDARVGKLR